MTNDKPFKILLDHHEDECFMLYSVVRTLFDYPSIDFDSDENYCNLNGKLYASAFAEICSAYLVDYTQMYPHEDFESFIHDMQFKNDYDELLRIAKKHNVETDCSLEKIIGGLLQKHRAIIITDINKLFTTDDLKLRLFASIFEMGETKGYQPSFSLNEGHPGTLFLRK